MKKKNPSGVSLHPPQTGDQFTGSGFDGLILIIKVKKAGI